MMPGFDTSSTMGSASFPARVEYNTSSDLSSEYIYEQGLSYSATNGYAYYTGFEAPVEWSEHTNFFGVDGQNLQLSNDNLPYVYCTPGYGFSYSSPDQYTYMPGMFMGVDGLYVGSQQYFPSPYQAPGSSPGYFPMFIQPTADFSSTVSLEPPLFSTGTSVASRPANTSIKNKHQMSGNTTPASQTIPSGSPAIGPSQRAYQNQSTNKLSDLSGANVTRHDKPSTSHFTIPVDASLTDKNRKYDEGNQLKDHVPPGRIYSFQNLQVTSGEWTSGDRGPRTDRPEVASVATTSGEGGQTKAVSSSASENIVIHPGQFNKDEFPVDHPDAKFFVIKSYSEDDVHKSIKYNVWSSTPNGNRRLDAAYSEAQGRTLGKCPIFLFFSVNTSGQFCGVAEMVGPVDFHKDMDFWQQDKWSGSFPVKWHLIKDVPNSTFRHIILENNENKPVTNSRDTQEIPYKWGINMLKLFNNSPMTTSILDDFPFYEGRQKAMLEEKRRRLGRSFDGLMYVPAFVAKSSVGVVGEPSEVGKSQFSIKDPQSGKTGQDCGACEQPDKVNRMKDTQVPKRVGVTLIEQPEHIKTDRDDFDATVDQQIKNCSGSVPPENGGRKPAGLSELVKVNGKGYNEMSGITPTGVVKVGSMHIKVNVAGELSSEIIGDGTGSLEPKGAEHIEQVIQQKGS